jgi:hypothetical protein
MKLFICANNFLLPRELETVMAITVTFYKRKQGFISERKYA